MKPKLKVFKGTCPHCLQEFVKLQAATYCSPNCRCLAYYHRTHPQAKTYDTFRTKELKKLNTKPQD